MRGNLVQDCSFPPTRIGDIINRHSNKIEYLELYLSQTDICQLGMDDIELPLLERVSFGPIFPAHLDNPVVVFPHAPRLRDVSLAASFEYYTLPWLQLTTFEGVIKSMELFSVALNLIEVKCSVESLDPMPVSPVYHPHLQSLAFVPIIKPPMDILPYLTLPSLQVLHISEVEDTAYPSLLEFFERSAPPLTTLYIRANNEDFVDWEKSVSSVGATLEKLELEYPTRAVQDSILCIDGDSYPFHRRVETSTTFPRLPKLTSLSFLESDGVDYDVLLWFLKKRSWGEGTARLKSFRLVWKHCTFLPSIFRAGPERDLCMRDLRRLAETGLNLHIGTESTNHLRW
ncbi:hypothetical protein B0H16DRAFT_1562416 [Mycena metata]|uniref:Uncharacterized protein n=1 Tax=Mycena metata TaxID=1033252 RepID=A0AAD7N1V7_9AGAR|nr:hypothetical protein B0H16DRAFT_1562416 [Mycena metata]